MARRRLERPLAGVVARARAVALQHVARVAAVRGHRAVAVHAAEVGHLDEAMADMARRGALGLWGGGEVRRDRSFDLCVELCIKWVSNYLHISK